MKLRRTFFTGLVIILPVWVTYWVVGLIFGGVNNALTPVMYRVARAFGSEWIEQAWIEYVAPVVSVLLAVSVIYLVGLVGGNVLGRQVLKMLEALLLKIPVVRGIYSTARQFLDTFSRPDGSTLGAVVLVAFPHGGAYTIGFLTAEVTRSLAYHLPPDMVTVFVPTSPNPTGGYVIFVPRSAVKLIDMSADDALKLVVSGGILTPEWTAEHMRPNLTSG